MLYVRILLQQTVNYYSIKFGYHFSIHFGVFLPPSLVTKNQTFSIFEIVLPRVSNEMDIMNKDYNPAGIYLLKVNNRNIRTMCEIRTILLTLNK